MVMKNYSGLKKAELKKLIKVRRIIILVGSGILTFYIESILFPNMDVYYKIALGSFISALIVEATD